MLCCGSIIGSRYHMLEFLKIYEAEFERTLSLSDSKCARICNYFKFFHVPEMILFFKVILKFDVSPLFKELPCRHSRCCKIITFCRRDLKKTLGVLWRGSISQKNFENFLV